LSVLVCYGKEYVYELVKKDTESKIKTTPKH